MGQQHWTMHDQRWSCHLEFWSPNTQGTCQYDRLPKWQLQCKRWMKLPLNTTVAQYHGAQISAVAQGHMLQQVLKPDMH